MVALPISAALENVLARGDVWRGNTLATLPETTIPSGFPDLDAELPGGGWPQGSLTEILVDRTGLGELGLCLPALAKLVNDGGHIALVAPPFLPYAPAWQAAGIEPEKLLVIQAPAAQHRQSGKQRLPDNAWCCEQLLASGGFAAVLAWLEPHSDERALRRLQVALGDKSCWACLWRPRSADRLASPAPLRLAVDASGTLNSASESGLSIRIIKRRGRPASRPLTLNLPRPGRHQRALVCPRISMPAAGSAVTAAHA